MVQMRRSANGGSMTAMQLSGTNPVALDVTAKCSHIFTIDRLKHPNCFRLIHGCQMLLA
jgi:hypothetical protein